MKRLAVATLSLLLFVTMSCDKNDNPTPEPTNKWDTSPEAYLKDTTLYWTKVLSLWQDNIIPANINDVMDSVKVRNITKDFQTAEALLEHLIGMTPKDPATNQPYDRFSFLDRESVVSEEIQNARSTSYGMYVIYLQTAESVKDNNNADLYIRMVDQNSSAYQAGLRRGDRILSINGNTKYDYNTQRAQGFKGINDALNTESMTVKWRKPNGQEVEKKITQAQYSVNPILNSWVAELDGQKVGYFAFSSFISIISNQGQPTNLFNSLETLFTNYENQGVKHLIVDLRYNGGGATLTAEYLANRIAPAIANGKRMYYYKLNPVVQRELGDEFPPTDFNKRGNLELTKVYFLVTSSTASASELLINSLKPYMDVQVIGSENTYGKPVGFWGIPIGKKPAKADIYVTSFQMFNSANFGDYFNGLTPNKLTREDFLRDFGDPQEGFIAEALYHIKNGAYSSGTRSAIASKDLQRVNSTHQVKAINTRISDMGMFKFGTENIKLK
ncbi:C-terminal processing protease CtpA/Prc [Sphingobacterium alimentarium]|uniref:C-terminal processing protease CtpA/Prc n=1 Tax=Sphingobacterium alimentarium TaxID=797292 RepID=A0A4R3W0D7_9SPHI|nr:S41 family peptidase [Sphingobacterium alimentarium]TCV19021.1 C-terminal processing protease CtpA/Prc [Sphingobacterium alimentarium]